MMILSKSTTSIFGPVNNYFVHPGKYSLLYNAGGSQGVYEKGGSQGVHEKGGSQGGSQKGGFK